MSQDIPASLVKEIRDKTSAPLLDCKKALEETNGNIEKAIEILKIKGLSKVDKKSGRDTSEGLIFSYIHAGGKIGVMLEVNCETDFVARNDEFQKVQSGELTAEKVEESDYVVERKAFVFKSNTQDSEQDSVVYAEDENQEKQDS